MRHRAMAAIPMTFGHRRILPPSPGHRANHPVSQGFGPVPSLGNVCGLENRGGHPGHDQGRRLSIPQVVAPLFLEMRVPRMCDVGEPRRRIMNRRSPCAINRHAIYRRSVIHGPPTNDVDGVILWRQRELSSTRRAVSVACHFCGEKQPVDKKLFFVPKVRSLSRQWASETPRPGSMYGVPRGQASSVHARRT